MSRSLWSIHLIFMKLFCSFSLTLQTHIIRIGSKSLVTLEKVDHALLVHDQLPALLTQVDHQALVPLLQRTQLLQLLKYSTTFEKFIEHKL